MRASDRDYFRGDMDENEHHKEVFAQFGLAAFKAQCLEEELINMLSVHALNDRHPLTRSDVTAAFEHHEQKTLGQLLKKTFGKVKYAPEMQATLEDALKRRNELIHGFFASRIQKFATQEGRTSLIDELQEHQAVFHIADQYVQIITTLIRKVVGITDEMLLEEAVRIFGHDKAHQLFKDI